MVAARKAKPIVRPRKRRATPAPGKASSADLKQQLAEARAQQAATAEILKVIARSPSDVQPVFDAIARTTVRLLGSDFSTVQLARDGQMHLVAHVGPNRKAFARYFPRPRETTSIVDVAIRRRKVVQLVPIVGNPKAPARTQELARKFNYNAIIAVPLVRDGEAIGAIATARREAAGFDDRQIAVLRTFADQAVIAIENVRLFNETREALERQTATAEILNAMSSSPSDVQPVFDAIVKSGVRLFENAAVAVARPEGGEVRLMAIAETDSGRTGNWAKAFPFPLRRDYVHAAAILDCAMVELEDASRDDGGFVAGRRNFAQTGYRAMTVAPMVRNGACIGTISVVRAAAGALPEKLKSLLRSFADQAVIAIENVRLFNETREALEQQKASADVLGAISGSITDTTPVFDRILDSCERLFAGNEVGVTLATADGKIDLAAYHGRDYDKLKGVYPLPLSRESGSGVAILDAAVAHYADVEAAGVPPGVTAGCRTIGMRSIIFAPMLYEGRGVGALWVGRSSAGEFTEKQVGLLRTFADQAVIAIQNARLFNETKEALERQTSTAEILRVIASSPADVQPVFDAIAQSATRLLDGFSTAVIRVEGDKAQLAAFTSTGKSGDAALRGVFPVAVSQAPGNVGRAMREKAAQWSEDVETDTTMPEDFRAAIRARGWRSGVAVPMVRQGEVIGAINVTRREPGRFSAHQIGLLTTFANQAVIAIENVRLFNETREALERQTATAEILKVISGSPTDVQPVFEAIVDSGMKLFSGAGVGIGIVSGEEVVIEAATGMGGVGKGFRMPLSRDSASGTAILERKLVNIADTEAPGAPPHARENGRRLGIRSMTQAPMFREGEPIGSIGVMLKEAGGLDDKQLALLRTFADQAVIAIENVRLFNETREALERQTATAEILRVIASSPSDVQPVFDAIVHSAERLFGRRASLRIVEPAGLRLRARSDGIRAETVKDVMPIDDESLVGQVALFGRAVQFSDLRGPDSTPFAREHAHTWNFRAIAGAPLVRDGKTIGVITVTSPETGAMTEKQMELLATFADQAVIAIENVRLFKELETRTQALTRSVGQLTALGEVGQAISSTLDLETVLQTIVSRAVQLTGMDAGSIYEYDEQAEVYRLKAAEKMAPELVEAVRQTPIRKGDGATGRTAVTLEPVQAADIQDASYQGSRKDNLMRTGYRAVLAVPLLREDHLLGALQVFRRTPGAFAPEVVELLKTFATQSAMAIQNARLFREIAQKGRELEEASRHKSDFLASMSHELRTPLNAILGFNEMILGQVYGDVPADMKEPLEDIQKSGKHLLRLINNVLDLAKIEAGRMELSVQEYSIQDTVESVRATLRPLAAEKGLEFRASVPGDLPLARGDGGRIAQCLMNLAGNSLKFTRSGKVEIAVLLEGDRLRFSVADTGIGIPADKIGGLFTEFKQTDASIASEYGGTGLGLSITKKFVEMHGGRIWVESEPGRGSSFLFEVPLRVST